MQRQKYIELVDNARTNGAVVRIFSSLHVSGEHLGQLTGVAAILRFPVHIPDDDDDDDDDDENDGDFGIGYTPASAASAATAEVYSDSDSEDLASSAFASRSVSMDPSAGNQSDGDS